MSAPSRHTRLLGYVSERAITDLRLVHQLWERDIPLTTAETALLFASVRRAARRPDASPRQRYLLAGLQTTETSTASNPDFGVGPRSETTGLDTGRSQILDPSFA